MIIPVNLRSASDAPIEPETKVRLSLRDAGAITVGLGTIFASIVGLYVTLDRNVERIEYRIQTIGATVEDGKIDRKEIRADLNATRKQVDRVLDHVERLEASERARDTKGAKILNLPKENL